MRVTLSRKRACGMQQICKFEAKLSQATPSSVCRGGLGWRLGWTFRGCCYYFGDWPLHQFRFDRGYDPWLPTYLY